jgi:hypothetical protein
LLDNPHKVKISLEDEKGKEGKSLNVTGQDTHIHYDTSTFPYKTRIVAKYK